jgi:hypothetical protein
MSGSIGKGATGIIDNNSFSDFRQDYRERLLFWQYNFSAKSGTTGGGTTSTAPTLPMDLNLQQLLIRL